MPQSSLPVPEAAGPIAGAPGHFAHHDWLTAAVKAADQALGFRQMALMLGASVAQALVNNTMTSIRLDLLLVKSPLLPAYTVTGSPATTVTLGDSWPTGLYRLDWMVAFAGVSGGGTYATAARTSRVTVNGAVPLTLPGIVTNTATGQSARSVNVGGAGMALLKPTDVITLDARQDSGANLDTVANNSFMLLTFHAPATLAVTP